MLKLTVTACRPSTTLPNNLDHLTVLPTLGSKQFLWSGQSCRRASSLIQLHVTRHRNHNDSSPFWQCVRKGTEPFIWKLDSLLNLADCPEVLKQEGERKSRTSTESYITLAAYMCKENNHDSTRHASLSVQWLSEHLRSPTDHNLVLHWGGGISNPFLTNCVQCQGQNHLLTARRPGQLSFTSLSATTKDRWPTQDALTRGFSFCGVLFSASGNWPRVVVVLALPLLDISSTTSLTWLISCFHFPFQLRTMCIHPPSYVFL